jgi:hypothetical protein
MADKPPFHTQPIVLMLAEGAPYIGSCCRDFAYGMPHVAHVADE